MRNFLVLISLSILSAGMFYFFTIQIFHDQYKQSVQSSYLDLLGSVGKSMDTQLDSVAKAMGMAMSYGDIIRASLNPDPTNYQRSKNITSFLSNMLVNHSALIHRAYYYVWDVETVYTSSDAVIHRDEFEEQDILNALDDPSRPYAVISGEKSSTRIYLIGGSLYLLQDFPMEKRLGTMICVLDTAELFQLILGRQNPGVVDALLIYSGDGRPIFSSFQSYPTPKLDSRLLQPTASPTVPLDGGDYYYHLGDRVQWIYLYRVNQGSLAVDNQLFLGRLAPFLAIFLLISLVVSVYSTLGIYHPVNQLIESVQPLGASLAGHRDEFDFLRHSYKNVVTQMGEYSATLHAVTPAVLRNLFNNLIMGRETDPAYIQETLSSLKYPFQMDSRYLVLLTRILQYNAARLPEMESNLCELKLTQILEQMTDCGLNRFLFTDYRGDFVTVLSFAPDARPQELQTAAAMLRCAHEEQGRSWPYQMIVVTGPDCGNIASLSQSYHGALQQVREKQYLLTDPKAVEFEQVDKAAFGLNDIEYDALKQRLHQVQQLLDEEKTQQAGQELDVLIEEISKTVLVADIAAHYEYVIDALTERVIPLVVRQGEQVVLDKEVIREKLQGKSLEETTAFVKQYCGALIRLIETHTSKKQNRYIAATRDYIAEHYADSSLSVNSTSEYIGIHASYLGRLFRDYLGTHFTNYLNEYRITVAKQLLTATNLSVTEIGFKTGFNSAQSFIRVFKKYEEMTPGQYRDRAM